MKFLKLLDPRATKEGSGISVGEQQNRATEQFPKLVEQSRLHYWSPGAPVFSRGRRILIGLAATFSLSDLRLADIINDEMQCERLTRVDVFNLDADCSGPSDLVKYFFRVPDSYIFTPVVGVWNDGVFDRMTWGHEGRRLVLDLIGASTTAEESSAKLAPPAESWIEKENGDLG